MATPAIIQKEAGQSQKLTTLLRDLVRRYPKTIGIFNEYLQNADDAEASAVEFILDQRTFPSAMLPAPQMAALMGPALLVYNNSVFDEDDFTSIQEIGDSGKTMELAKTGRFGFGFNASYNITDFPTFLSREWLYLFDPHRVALPNQQAGVAYKLTPDLWRAYPDLLRPFQCAGLEPGTTDFRGTIFRLPLRTPERAPASLIRTEPFTPEDFRILVGRFAETAGAALIFLKHVLRIAVYEIANEHGARTEVLDIDTENGAEVTEARDALTRAIASADGSLLERLAGAGVSRVFEHRVTIRRERVVTSSRWQIASGFYFDAAGTVLAAARQMIEAGEKAVPWVGVAALLANDVAAVPRPRKVEGHAFCFLPLPITTGLPVHVHGFFDLGSDRQTLTRDPNSLGRDEVRVKWNEVLCQLSMPMAYRDLLVALRHLQREAADAGFYDVWPDTDTSKEQPIKLVSVGVYRAVEKDLLIRRATKDGQPWADIKSLLIPPAGRPLIQAALVADGLAIPDPLLPQHVRDGFRAAGVKVARLTPHQLRLQLQLDADLDVSLDSAPRPCLTRREWVEDLLRYCLEEENVSEKIGGLPLALAADGHLHTFGKFRSGWCFLGGEVERRLCASQPQWFVDADFARSCNVPTSTTGRIAEMTPSTLALNLPVILDPQKSGEPSDWRPDGPDTPNATWLTDVFDYLAQHHGEVLKIVREWKVQPPLLPDQHGRLCPANATTSPLLVPGDLSGNRTLLDALDVFDVLRVQAAAPLRDAIDRFANSTNGSFVRYLTGPNLVSALKDLEAGWCATAGSRYRADVHDAVLDFLSDDRWTYTPDEVRTLQSLPIFPTEDGQLVQLTGSQVFVTPEEPPQIPCEVKLLKLGRNGRWRSWLLRLGVQPLDHSTLIREVLLPRYADFDAGSQHELLRWIRDRLRTAVRQLERGNQESAVSLRELVAEAELFRCTDGTLRSARRIYDPNQRVIHDILADRAYYVAFDPYTQEWDDWLSFLQYLGMPQTPLPEDLLRCIDNIVELAQSGGVESVREQVDRLFRHLAEHWDLLENATVADPEADGDRRVLSEALADRYWLVAETDAKRMSRYAGFVVPEKRLYRPAELYPIRVAHLCSSQRPLAAHSRVSANFTRAIGMPATVPDDIVVAHFSALLDLWGSAEHGHLSVTVLQASLQRIYARLGGAHNTVTEDVDEQDDASNTGDATPADLKQRFAGHPCLWDWSAESPRFWRPEHSFRTKVPFFEPYRACLKIRDGAVDRGYEVLGRRDEPGVEDFIAFLEEVSEHHPELLPPDHIKQVLYVEARLAHAVASLERSSSTAIVPKDVPLLTQEDRFVAADVAYYCDAEWLLARFEPGRIHVLHPGTDYAVAQYLNVPRLSEGIKERLLTVQGWPSDMHAVSNCERWQQTLRSPEFTSGLRRLLRCTPTNDVNGLNLNWLQSVELCPVGLIRTELVVDRCAGATAVGSSECDEFVYRENGSEPRIIYLSQFAESQMDLFLIRAIIKQLAPLQLDRQLELQQIVNAAPESIDTLLTRLKVPRLEEHETQADSEGEDGGLDIQTHENAGDVWVNEGGEGEQVETNLRAAADDSVEAEGEPPADSKVADEDDQEHLPVVGPGEAAAPSDRSSRTDPEVGRARIGPGQPGGTTPSAGGAGAPRSGSASAGAAPGASLPSGAQGASADEDQEADGQTPAGRTGGVPRTSQGPPTRDTHGKPSGGTTSKRHRGRALTYVVPENATPPAERDPGDDEQRANMMIGQAAVDHVLRYEKEVLNRKARSMAHNNPGYDVESTAQDDSDTRYIEVKGIDGAWPDDGVPLSRTQFELAQKYQDTYWLYVVENARSKSAKVHPIQNPSKRVTQFRFDPGWRDMALGTAGHLLLSGDQRPTQSVTPPSDPTRSKQQQTQVPSGESRRQTPRIGKRIRWSDGMAGRITGLQTSGRFFHLEVKLNGGAEVRGLFDPGKMSLLED